MMDIENIKLQIAKIKDAEALEALRIEYLGRNGKINVLAKELKSATPEKRKELGKKLNALKKEVEDIICKKKVELDQNDTFTTQITAKDILPSRTEVSHLHPTTLTIRQLNNYFQYLGYSIYEGPEIETDQHNFDMLNVPTDHPARDLQDTLYISDPEYLLRTHTSSVQIRCMTTEDLPIRIIVPGKCYRNESVNASNNAIFYQMEGLVIDKGIHMGHLRETLEQFARYLYGDDVKTRFRCKYYPFVEPGAGMDIACKLCGGEGCAFCKYRGWIEVLGSGMVHPEVLRKCGIDPAVYSGFAFGMGLDRLVMMTYGINDIRNLYNGELVWKE